MKTILGTIRMIDGSMISSAYVLDGKGNHMDGAWGTWPELVGWLSAKGYPNPDTPDSPCDDPRWEGGE